MSAYQGMKIRPSFDQVVNYIQHNPYKIKYPNRDATFMMNSPYFLNLMGEGSIGLEEQNQGLIKAQMAQALSRARGKGGVVDVALSSSSGDEGFATANEGGDGDMQMMSPRSLERERAAARAQKRLRAEEEMRRQEEARKQNEELIRQQHEQLRREEEAKRARAQQMAASSLALVTGHPTAAAAASAAPTFTVTPEMMNMLRRVQEGSLLVPANRELAIQYLRPPGQTAITPYSPTTDITMTTPPLTVPVQTKRTASPPREAPKAKAKPTPAIPSSPGAVAANLTAAAATESKGSSSGGIKQKTLKPDEYKDAKITDDKYSTWAALTKKQIYNQLIQHHKLKPHSESTYNKYNKDYYLQLAEKMVNLVRTGMDAKSEGRGRVQPSLPIPGAGKKPAGFL